MAETPACFAYTCFI